MSPRRLITIINAVQSILDFKNLQNYQFREDQGLGRASVISCILSCILTFNAMMLASAILDRMNWIKTNSLLGLSESRELMIIQGHVYAIVLCVFHLAEFFVTAMYNPAVVSSQSFIINHSRSYTIAMILSWIEFLIRFVFFPSCNYTKLAWFGIFMVICSQCVRSLSMVTCGESFNHIIQHQKKQNHVLVTSGIYKYLRHPSYFGFYYWSIGTQLLLGNMINAITFAIASWFFFNRRIPFEESTLLRLFPEEYPKYMSQTSIWIPFIKQHAITSNQINSEQ